MKFFYTVTTKEGAVRRGVIEATSRREAEDALRAQGLGVIVLEGKSRVSVSTSRLFSFFGKISAVEKIFFTKHLALLIKSGISLKESLDTLREQSGSRAMRRILDSLIRSVEGGESFAASLSRHPGGFNQLFINIIRVGEGSGKLEENLQYLARQLEKEYTLKQKIIAAMIYPGIILTLALFIAAAMVLFVLPRFLPLLKSLRIELPLTTKILIAISEFSQDYGLISLFVIAGIIIAFRFFVALPVVHFIVSGILLKLPLVGKMTRFLTLASFTRNLGTLLKSGVPILEALDITSRTIGNAVYRKKLSALLREIEKGESIGENLGRDPVFFPPTLSRMIAVGERSGNLDETLEYLADFYEKEVDNLTTNLSDIIQPFLMIIVGIVVGFIALSIITPIYKFHESLRR